MKSSLYNQSCVAGILKIFYFIGRCSNVRQICTSPNAQLEQLCIRLLCPEFGYTDSKLSEGPVLEEKRENVETFPPQKVSQLLTKRKMLYSALGELLNNPESEDGLPDLDNSFGLYNNAGKIKVCIQNIKRKKCTRMPIFENNAAQAFVLNSFWPIFPIVPDKQLIKRKQSSSGFCVKLSSQ